MESSLAPLAFYGVGFGLGGAILMLLVSPAYWWLGALAGLAAGAFIGMCEL